MKMSRRNILKLGFIGSLHLVGFSGCVKKRETGMSPKKTSPGDTSPPMLRVYNGTSDSVEGKVSVMNSRDKSQVLEMDFKLPSQNQTRYPYRPDIAGRHRFQISVIGGPTSSYVWDVPGGSGRDIKYLSANIRDDGIRMVPITE